MILPSIDLQGGAAVQLIGGRDRALDAGDPFAVAERFSLAGEIAVVDLDAALGTGDNREVVEELVRRHPCRVAGGIRDVGTALRWLDLGATRVVLGTAADPGLLRQLPRERVVAALDAYEDEVVVEGWRHRTGARIEDRIDELREWVGGFLVTFVEREGRLGGTRLGRAAELAERCAGRELVIAGGITTVDEVAALDRLGLHAQLGMGLYTGRLRLADAIAAPLRSDRPDGLWPTVVVDESGTALGLAWSDAGSLREAVELRRGVYHSRSRGRWRKGESSGATQELLRVDLDCDRDALRFTVRQDGSGFCHGGTRTCWGEDRGLGRLSRRLVAAARAADVGAGDPASYTARLLREGGLLEAKIREEAEELCRAEDRNETVHEAADLVYFTLVALARAGIPLDAVEAELDRRERRVRRRRGDAKPGGLR